MEVELDAFSGRPNPKWTLSAKSASHLLEKLASLPEAKEVANPPDLGFRGFVLRSGGRSIRVFGGQVVIESASPAKIYRDTAGIHAELAQDAQARGFGSLTGN